MCCVLHEDWSCKIMSTKQSCCPLRLILDNAQEQLKVFSWHSFLITSVVQGHRYKPLVSLDSFTKIKTRFMAFMQNSGKNQRSHFSNGSVQSCLLKPSSAPWINSLPFTRAAEALCADCAADSPCPESLTSPVWGLQASPRLCSWFGLNRSGHVVKALNYCENNSSFLIFQVIMWMMPS